eukprot:12332080-Alexandrium_andersonii.AAC.1
MGFFPARERHSEIGLTPQTPQDSMNRLSSERAAATSSGGRTAPVVSPRNCCAPLPVPWPPEHSGRAGPPGSSLAGALKSATTAMSA